MRSAFAVALLAVALSGAACGGGGGNGPMDPSPNPPNNPPGGGSSQTLTGSVSPFAYTEHTVSISQTGNLTATLTWTGANDLDLYLTAGNCADVYGANACTRLAVSDLTDGNTESVTRAVQSGEQYKIWVDNFSSGAQAYSVHVEVR